jgi:hypothetical protein
MEIKVIASTKIGYQLPKEEALDFSGKSAGICYLPDTLETLFAEAKEKTQRRVNGNLQSGHHSVFAHATYNLSLEGIPKIIAMILNNEKVYNTSEKSARYTKMECSEEEKKLYDKWIEIYKQEISKEYPNLEEKKVQKLAQENARYLISIFTPATIMEYSVNFQQLNFMIGWFEDYIKEAPETVFSIQLKKAMKEFLEKLPDLKVEELNAKMKGRSLSIFAQRERAEEFGENYSTNYLASFAQLAQAQRHRTISYEMTLLDTPVYYIPPIIKGTELEEEWIKDISSLKEHYPQGMCVKVNERGTIENFVLKCTERLCGAAQLEIAIQTDEIMKKYMANVKDNPILYHYLLPYSKGARCTFPGWKCTSPCVFGGKNAMTRKI